MTDGFEIGAIKQFIQPQIENVDEKSASTPPANSGSQGKSVSQPIQLSSNAEVIRAASQALNNVPDVRDQSRIKALQLQVEQGNLQVYPDLTAAKIAKTILPGS